VRGCSLEKSGFCGREIKEVFFRGPVWRINDLPVEEKLLGLYREKSPKVGENMRLSTPDFQNKR